MSDTKTRPWTVTVLLVWAIVGVIWDLTSGQSVPSTWMSGFGILGATVIAFGAWTAKRWAFVLMLGGTLFLMVIVLPATLFLENEEVSTLVVPLISIGGQLLLLLHPGTRAFALQGTVVIQQAPPSTPDLQTQPLGVRRNTVIALVFLLTAIAIAGTLGVIRIYQMTG